MSSVRTVDEPNEVGRGDSGAGRRALASQALRVPLDHAA
jgi:hypothetical protein